MMGRKEKHQAQGWIKNNFIVYLGELFKIHEYFLYHPYKLTIRIYRKIVSIYIRIVWYSLGLKGKNTDMGVLKFSVFHLQTSSLTFYHVIFSIKQDF